MGIIDLLQKNNTLLGGNKINEHILYWYDKMLEDADKQNTFSTEAISIYQKFIDLSTSDIPQSTLDNTCKLLNNFAKAQAQNNRFYDALLIYRLIFLKFIINPEVYLDILSVLAKINQKKLAKELGESYKNAVENYELGIITLANLYNFDLGYKKEAIQEYEKYTGYDKTRASVYTMIASLYKELYGDDSLIIQLINFESAYKLKPDDRGILHSLAFGYEKQRKFEKAQIYYQKLLENKPTEIDYFNYGGFLISWGKLEEGHKYLTHRFNINDINLQYPQKLSLNKKWNLTTKYEGKDIIVHYEQGFGDTIMYCRFLPLLSQKVNKVYFVVQDELFNLLKNSEVFKNIQNLKFIPESTDFSNIKYDFNIALLDVPCITGISSENMTLPKGYLSVDDEHVSSYRRKNINKNNKLKVGIAYKGNQKVNYSERDLNFDDFKKLLDIDTIELYSFNMEDEKTEGVTNLSSTFNNFTDTACALKNMDIVLTTDNVILNLAGALGVKSYAIFKFVPNFRWYKIEGDNVGWYESVTPIYKNDILKTVNSTLV